MPQDEQKNVFLISGTDEAKIGVEAAKLVRKYAGEAPDPFSLDVVREQEGSSVTDLINQLLRSIDTPPFLGGRKTVWMQNFSRFDAEGAKTSKTADAVAIRGLASRIKEGIPSDIVLIMDGPGLDSKKALATACAEVGELINCRKPELRDRDWGNAMSKLIQDRASDKGIVLDPAVCTHLVDILGTDTAGIDSELEKLICYVGGTDQPITLAAAEEICAGHGEEVYWALANAMGERDLAETLRVVDILSRQAKDADGTARSLLLQGAGCVRQLLQIRVLMAEHKLRSPSQVKRVLDEMSSEAKNTMASEGLEVAGMHPYRVQKLAEQAVRYSGPELIQAVMTFRDAYRKSVSSSASTRVLLEEALVRTVSPPSRRR